jgi:hypothetical protein
VKHLALALYRFASRVNATVGALFDVSDGTRRFLAFILEDEFRTKKVFGETRIPAGVYPLSLRKEGGFHTRYAARFPELHRGMLWLREVPGFQYVLIHIGNTDEDTAGCLLVGDSAFPFEDRVLQSTAAYTRIYPPIAKALEEGDQASIAIIDFATPPPPREE